MRFDFAVVALAVFSALCVIGACNIYLVSSDVHAHLSLNDDDSITIEIGGSNPEDYSCLILSNVHVYDRILFYYDDGYPVWYETETAVKRMYDMLDRMMDSRGFHGFEMVDADGLPGALSDTADAGTTALFVATGALPDTVHDGNGYPLLESWLAAGGSLYWMNGNPCARYATGSGLVEADGMFDASWFNSEVIRTNTADCTPIAEEFGFGYVTFQNAIRADVPGSKPMGTVHDGLSSMSEVVSPYGGRVFILSSTMPFEQTSALADYLLCGVTGDTVVVDKVIGHKGRGDFKTTMPRVDVGDLLFLKVGKPNTICGDIVILRP